MIRNFTLGEMSKSDTASMFGIDNSIPSNLEDTVLNTLQMMQYIRDHLSAVKGKDCPITITSGYRSARLNKVVGGAKTSDHLAGCAVDFRCPAFGSPLVIARELAKYLDELHIGQLINEHPERDGMGWIHVSTRRPVKPFNRVITISDKGTFPGVQDA